MAGNTMDAIKKKMQTMRAEKEAARYRAEQFEQKLLLQRTFNQQVGRRPTYPRRRFTKCLTAIFFYDRLTIMPKLRPTY